MLLTHFLLGPTTPPFLDVLNTTPSTHFNTSNGPCSFHSHVSHFKTHRFATSAAINSHRNNHYAVLGVSPNASISDIKKAYRLLAKKYHPDVSKSSSGDEVFKRIRLAYDVLSDETTRNQYDRSLRLQEYTSRPSTGGCDNNVEYTNGVKFYRWANIRQKMQSENYWEPYYATATGVYEEVDENSENEILEEERGSFVEVLKSAFLTIFLVQTAGIRLSLMFSFLAAFFDQKLDSGYKMGYFLAWVLGGRGGVMLMMFLSFAIWVCGKTRSSVVALTLLAMFMATYAPLPQGALLALLYMSIKLQDDLN